MFTRDGDIIPCLEKDLEKIVEKNKCEFVLFPVHPWEDITQYLVVNPDFILIDLTESSFSFSIAVVGYNYLDDIYENGNICILDNNDSKTVRGNGMLFFYRMLASIISACAFNNHSTDWTDEHEVLLDVQDIIIRVKHPQNNDYITIPLNNTCDFSESNLSTAASTKNLLNKINKALGKLFRFRKFEVISDQLSDIMFNINLSDMKFSIGHEFKSNKQCRDLLYLDDWHTCCMLDPNEIATIVGNQYDQFLITRLSYLYYGDECDLPYDIHDPQDMYEIDGFEIIDDFSLQYHPYGLLEFLVNMHLIYQYMEILYSTNADASNILINIKCRDKNTKDIVDFSFNKGDIYSDINLYDEFFKNFKSKDSRHKFVTLNRDIDDGELPF